MKNNADLFSGFVLGALISFMLFCGFGDSYLDHIATKSRCEGWCAHEERTFVVNNDRCECVDVTTTLYTPEAK